MPWPVASAHLVLILNTEDSDIGIYIFDKSLSLLLAHNFSCKNTLSKPELLQRKQVKRLWHRRTMKILARDLLALSDILLVFISRLLSVYNCTMKPLLTSANGLFDCFVMSINALYCCIDIDWLSLGMFT